MRPDLSYWIGNLADVPHGVHDLPGLETATFRVFAMRLRSRQTLPPVDQHQTTLLLVVEGEVELHWQSDTPAKTLTAQANTHVDPVELESLRAGEDGCLLLAFKSR